jgi:alcohol dehydrogenase
VCLVNLLTLDQANYCADFAFDDIHNAYEAFEASSKHGALKVVVTMPELITNGFS